MQPLTSPGKRGQPRRAKARSFAVKRGALRARVPHQQRAIRTREELTRSAIQLFARRGVHAITLNELARSIGKTTGVLYFHFANKDEIVLAAFEQLQTDFVAAFAEAATDAFRALSPTEQLRRFFTIGETFLATPPEHGTFFSMLAAGASDLDPRIATALRGGLDTYAENIARLVRRGQRAGEFRTEVDPDAFAHLVLGSAIGLCAHVHLYRNAPAQRATIGLLANALLDSVLRAPRPRPRRPRAR